VDISFKQGRKHSKDRIIYVDGVAIKFEDFATDVVNAERKYVTAKNNLQQLRLLQAVFRGNEDNIYPPEDGYMGGKMIDNFIVDWRDANTDQQKSDTLSKFKIK
tara:strand:- start:3882 stop:4193 length:312 start_codon:yes stop_codon:yes gene_type:complete